jgi:hypothetical protein
MRKAFATAGLAAALAIALAIPGIAPARAQDQQENLFGATLVDSYVSPKGAFVNVVKPGGAAAAGGILSGDVVTAADGKTVTGANDLRAILAQHRPGDALSLHVVRFGNTQKDFRVALGGGTAAPATAQAPPPSQAPAAPAPAQNATQQNIQWVTYADPSEHAFTLQVPAGWRFSGGSRRMSTIEIRSGVEAVSPDGAIILFYGDLGIPIFTLPTPLLQRAGFRPGMTYSPGYGQSFMVMPYNNGQSFAANWGAMRVSRECGGAARASSRPRPDSSQGITAAYAQNGIRTSVLAGEAGFSCNLRGAPATGYVFAATELVQSQVSSLWDVKSVVGFIATNQRAAEATALLGHMVSSFAIDPNWAARQQQNAAQTDRVVQQTNQVVSSAIQANFQAEQARSNAIMQNYQSQQNTSNMIIQGGQQRSNETSNAIENYDENAVRGTSTYVNPDTGTARTLDNEVSHQYVNPSGTTYGTNSENQPGYGWTELQRVPAGQ